MPAHILPYSACILSIVMVFSFSIPFSFLFFFCCCGTYSAICIRILLDLGEEFYFEQILVGLGLSLATCGMHVFV